MFEYLEKNPLTDQKSYSKVNLETALELIASSNPRECAPGLRHLVNLRSSDDARSFVGISKCLESNDISLLKTAAEAAGIMKAKSLIPQLMKLLDQSDEAVKVNVIIALGKLGVKEMANQLEELLHLTGNTDLDGWIRRNAARALYKLSNDEIINP